ncbi:hypothetical protein [Promicromonospora soli]|uniref:Uncharacterized protein n=1 Tax=Promicromonospora soli TaxID=2035533 RepID=A0A919G8S2_9MICO|nr:hypothetical protein [Promicromonospora soli]GHH80207.1 hypothetical protein GCM10017772_47820 [Promicromonospora soli]
MSTIDQRHAPVNTEPMRQAFAHEAVVAMEADGDIRALGAAITVALCGHWEHDPPCPLAPHHTAAERFGAKIRLRVLFATDPAAEADVRGRIEGALARTGLNGPDGVTTRWQVHSARPSPVREDEAEHAERLVQA